jgi:hypothetical protein
MNYAEDRSDRRARQGSLFADYQSALDETLINNREAATGHTLLATVLRDAGLCRQALYHYGMAWIFDNQAVGDYAQMAEFSGFPEVGILALLHYRRRGPLLLPAAATKSTMDNSSSCVQPRSQDWLTSVRKESFVVEEHCGCGSPDCGAHPCFLPCPVQDLEPLLMALQRFTGDYARSSNHDDMPSAYGVLSLLSKAGIQKDDLESVLSTIKIDPILEFWKDDDGDSSLFRPLEPVLQLLLTKLCYGTIPSLAAIATAHLCLKYRLDPSLGRSLAAKQKSHHAYFALLEAIVLGNRIKPHRRQVLPDYHVPVWDIVWGKDSRYHQDDENETVKLQEHDGSWLETVRLRLAHAEKEMGVVPMLPFQPPMGRHSCCKSLYVMGDSHVMSIAWQIVRVCGRQRLLVPAVVTGLKAWHTRPGTPYFTHTLLHEQLYQLSSAATRAQQQQTIIFSAGEIDCREGMGGPLLEGYQMDISECRPYVQRTAREYVSTMTELAKKYNLQILLLPVAPHAHRSNQNGKTTGRAFRRSVIHEWNLMLRSLLKLRQDAKEGNVYLLDYEEHLREPSTTSPTKYVLKKSFNADCTHMNSAFLPHLERSIEASGCNMEVL